MPPKILVRAGVYLLAAGIFLYWSVPIWLRFNEPYEWDWLLAGIVAWLALSMAGAGFFLLIRAAFSGLAAHANSSNNLSD